MGSIRMTQSPSFTATSLLESLAAPGGSQPPGGPAKKLGRAAAAAGPRRDVHALPDPRLPRHWEGLQEPGGVRAPRGLPRLLIQVGLWSVGVLEAQLSLGSYLSFWQTVLLPSEKP